MRHGLVGSVPNLFLMNRVLYSKQGRALDCSLSVRPLAPKSTPGAFPGTTHPANDSVTGSSSIAIASTTLNTWLYCQWGSAIPARVAQVICRRAPSAHRSGWNAFGPNSLTSNSLLPSDATPRTISWATASERISPRRSKRSATICPTTSCRCRTPHLAITSGSAKTPSSKLTFSPNSGVDSPL